MTLTDDTVPTGPGGPDPQVVAATLEAELSQRSAMIATAESLTGGALGDLLSAAPGASETYLGGVVTYATELKQRLLGVSADCLDQFGVVSAQCAEQMAIGVRELTGADYGVSTTGVAGPATQEGKPVGLVYLGFAGPHGTSTAELNLDGERAEIRRQVVLEAVSFAIARLKGMEQ